ncbi:NADP-dependent oxidoreductase [Paludibaculum fermentans]|uniref:NADP-dependent oxidoreductase n=1 Tax=Paludibaculum fermentans TaxID=1473598 RepID=A0A7S7SP37_PALFE|nr:NADP-dependent oxidoreductase [Paludibaculum fermentans]QOY90760.1 NADP-dependent oxidoreductase [Paludibaculum fermentans]
MPLPDRNRRIVLAAVPVGLPLESDFLLEEAALPTCPTGGLLVRSVWISVDPYLRGRITGRRSYVDPILTGSVMESGAVGEVIESRHPAIGVGAFVTGMWGWQDYAAVEAEKVLRLDPAEAPIQTALGVLGMPGMTAYFGLTELCAPKAGETVLVSGAAGAVGSAVGQIAKILGCKVVGTTGTDSKVQYIRSLGFDGALNYRTDQPYPEALARLCPNGIDCYFDNVGGELTDAAMTLMNFRGRVAVCGQISQYNDRSKDVGQRPFTEILVKQLRVEGFIVTRWAARFPEGRKQMATWWKEGRLRNEETITDGLENAPKAFIGLFRGENTGKALVRL